MEENFSMEWNMEWKIFGMDWKWNGRKLPVWNMEKSSSIPYHALPRGHILKFLALASKVKSLALASKHQVLENCPVLGLKTALFFEQLKFRWKAPENSRKICEHLFCFPHLEHRRSQGGKGGGKGPGSPAIEISSITKIWQKAYCFFSFSFFLAFFAYNSN